MQKIKYEIRQMGLFFLLIIHANTRTRARHACLRVVVSLRACLLLYLRTRKQDSRTCKLCRMLQLRMLTFQVCPAAAQGERGVIFAGLTLFSRQQIRNFACHSPETLNNTQHFHPLCLQLAGLKLTTTSLLTHPLEAPKSCTFP